MRDYKNKPFSLQEKLVKMLGMKQDPSISIIVNKDAPSPRNEKFRIQVKNSIKQVLKKLEERQFNKSLIKDFETKLQSILDEIKFERDFQSIAIYFSTDFQEVITLPFEVRSSVVVDNTFEIRPLLRAVNRMFQYDVILLSKKKTRYFNGFHKYLQEVFTSDLPEGVDYYFNQRVQGKEDPGKRESEAIRLYVKDIDKFLRLYSDMHTPLIVMGDKKLVSYFHNNTKAKSKILAEITGSYDDEKLSAIQDKIREKLDEYIQTRDQQLLERVQRDIDAYNYVSGIQEAWTAAAMKEARILLVDQDYKVQGYSVDNGLFLLLVEPENEEYDFHEDAIDDLAEMVLLQGGEVFFVSKGLLDKYEHILLTLR